jgi:hypothetical protein
MWRHYLRSPGFRAEGFAYATDQANRSFHESSRRTPYLPRRYPDTPHRKAGPRESAARPRQLPTLLTSPSALQSSHLGLRPRLHGPHDCGGLHARFAGNRSEEIGFVHACRHRNRCSTLAISPLWTNIMLRTPIHQCTRACLITIMGLTSGRCFDCVAASALGYGVSLVNTNNGLQAFRALPILTVLCLASPILTRPSLVIARLTSGALTA